ncbi:MAG: pre-peptidase C-terminal domain-containing protein, partial [Thermoplasmata archaeon]
RVVLDGPNGADFDLYVKKGALPTISSYDARGYTNSADEQVSISNPAGTYYIMVNRYSGSGSYTITATVEGGGSEGVPELVLGQTYSDRLSATGEKKYYKTVVSAPDTLIIELRGGSGKDFDLYAKKGAKPTQTDYDRFAHSSTADETITYQNALPGTYYIMVRSYSGSGNFTLKAYLASSMPDTDGDGLWDAVEIGYGLDPYSPQYSGCAEKIPWSGYWWPYNEGGTSEAGKKYDEYVNRTHGYNPGLYQWELSKHGNPNADYWVGHCHAWSAAAILEDEPTRPVTRNGVTFYVGNLKALLTEAHFSDPVEFNIGVKNNAKQFHITLLKWIGTLRKPIVADISQTAEVWNHPLYKYSMSVTVDAQDSSIRHYVTTVTYVSDGVNPDYVGHLDFTKTYYYYLKFQNGDIVGWGWEGESAGNGSTARPDFFWRPAGQACAATCPLNYTLLKTEILGW